MRKLFDILDTIWKCIETWEELCKNHSVGASWLNPQIYGTQ